MLSSVVQLPLQKELRGGYNLRVLRLYCIYISDLGSPKKVCFKLTFEMEE